MKKIAAWLLALPTAIILIGFALANRSIVKISLDPISSESPWFALNTPLWTVLFAGIFIGLVVGWIAAWINQGKWRKAAHTARTRLDDEIAKKRAVEKRLNLMNDQDKPGTPAGKSVA